MRRLAHVAFEDLRLFEPVLKHRGYEFVYVQAGTDALSRQDWGMPISSAASVAKTGARPA
jgi:hypothetical protein